MHMKSGVHANDAQSRALKGYEYVKMNVHCCTLHMYTYDRHPYYILFIIRYLNKNVLRHNGNIIYAQIISKVNVHQMPTTYARNWQSEHPKRRKTCQQSVYKHCLSDSQAPSKHQLLERSHITYRNTSYITLSATTHRESVQVIRDVSEHRQAVV